MFLKLNLKVKLEKYMDYKLVKDLYKKNQK